MFPSFCTLRHYKFLSTPSARRATIAESVRRILGGISIHALREEGDHRRSMLRVQKADFYPRPPRGGRLLDVLVGAASAAFLSTPSARRATTAAKEAFNLSQFLSTPSARRATRGARHDGHPAGFLSTPSARRATQRHTSAGDILCISIHALREEGDPQEFCSCSVQCRISIHALREEGDRQHYRSQLQRRISIHALREEGDWKAISGASKYLYFYPRPPRGGRHGLFA